MRWGHAFWLVDNYFLMVPSHGRERSLVSLLLRALIPFIHKGSILMNLLKAPNLNTIILGIRASVWHYPLKENYSLLKMGILKEHKCSVHGLHKGLHAVALPKGPFLTFYRIFSFPTHSDSRSSPFLPFKPSLAFQSLSWSSVLSI